MTRREPIVCACGVRPLVRNMNLDEWSLNTLNRVVCMTWGKDEGCGRQTAIYHDERRAIEEWDAMILGIEIMLKTREQVKVKRVKRPKRSGA